MGVLVVYGLPDFPGKHLGLRLRIRYDGAMSLRTVDLEQLAHLAYSDDGSDGRLTLGDCPYRVSDPRWNAWQRIYADYLTRHVGSGPTDAAIAAAGFGPVRHHSPGGRHPDPGDEGYLDRLNADNPHREPDRVKRDFPWIDDLAPWQARSMLWVLEPDEPPAPDPLWPAAPPIHLHSTPVAVQRVLDPFPTPRGGIGHLFGPPTPPEPQPTIKGRPAGRSKACRHGNPRGACRECSLGGRSGRKRRRQ